MKTARSLLALAGAVVGLAAPSVVVPAPALGAGVTYISFEDLPASCGFASVDPLRNRYAAAKFRGPDADDGGAVLDNCSGFGIAPRTGSRFLAFNDDVTMANGGTARGPEKILLPTRQKKVTLWVSQSGIAVGNATFKLVGRRDGSVVQTATVSTSTSAWVELTVRSRKGFDAVTLSTPVEPDGSFLADDLTMVN